MGFPCINNYYTFEFILFQISALTITIFLYFIKNQFHKILFAISILVFVDLFVVLHLFRQIEASFLCAIFVYANNSKKTKSISIIVAFGIHFTTGLLFTLFYNLYFLKLKNKILLILFSTIFIILYKEYIEKRYGFAFDEISQSYSEAYIDSMYKYFILMIVMCFWGSKSNNNFIIYIIVIHALLLIAKNWLIGADAIFRLMIYFRYVLFPFLLSIKVLEIFSLYLKIRSEVAKK
jgi:hypothetical protein